MSARALCLLLSFSCLAACRKGAGDATAPPSGADGASVSSPAQGDDLDTLVAELARKRSELDAAGAKQEAATAGESQGDRCQRVCELREVICDLADRICALASEHEGEAQYSNACETATDDCATATKACDGCSV